VTLLPLEGFTIGVTADRRASEQSELLRRRGASVVGAPAVTTAYLGCDDRLRAATDAILQQPPTHFVVTTAIGLRAWMEAAQSWGVDEELLRCLSATDIIARGPKAAAATQAMGLHVWRTAPDERMRGVREIVDELAPRSRIAVQCFGDDERAIVESLGGSTSDIAAIPVYRWELPPEGSLQSLVTAVLDRRVHAVTFTSAPAVRNVFAAAAASGREDALRQAFNDDVVAACVGPACAAVASEAGVAEPTAPEVGRLGLMVRALSERLAATRRTFTLGGEIVETQGIAAVVGARHVGLTPREASVLRALSERPGAVLSAGTLLRRITGGSGEEHAVGAAVGRLRRKLGDAGAAIVTVPRRGYRLEP
jgi:uroporphyrinogen-III synthase